MKNWIAALSVTLIAGFAHAAAPIDCLQTVLKTPELMPEMKKMYANYAFHIENRATSLCAGTTNAEATIDCYKEAVSNPDVLKGIKEQFARTPFKIEEAAIALCRP